MARRGRKRTVEVTKVNHQPRESNLGPQEAVRWWKAFRECIRSQDGHHVTSALGTHFGRLVLMGVFSSEQYEAGLALHQTINDSMRVVMDGDDSKLKARISSAEPRTPSHEETRYTEAQVRAAQDRYNLCFEAVVGAPRGASAWDAILELVVMDRHIDWEEQRLVSDALTRLVAALSIAKRTK
jgi:hypothetical protein